MKAVLSWAQQPTSIAGFAAILGTFSALLLHQVTLSQAVPLLVGAISSIILPDSAGAKTSAEALVSTFVSHSVAPQDQTK